MVVDEVKRVSIGQARATELPWEPERHTAGVIERLQLVRLEVDLDRREIVSELRLGPHTNNRDRYCALLLGSHPRDRYLTGARTARVGDLVDSVRDREIALRQGPLRVLKGYRDLPKLLAAIHRELNPTIPTEETVTLIAA
jgi:hypothetical protein